ncbi:WD40 repeat domain-containing protein [Streptomyces phaeochromogenes]
MSDWAEEQRQAAVDGRQTATSRELATKSTLLATAEPDASMLLAAEAFRQGRTTEARGALLSAQSQRLAGVLPGHRGSVRSLAFPPDGRLLATAAADRTVRLWDVSTRRSVAVLTGHRKAVASVAFSPDGRYVAAGGARTGRCACGTPPHIVVAPSWAGIRERSRRWRSRRTASCWPSGAATPPSPSGRRTPTSGSRG